MKHTNDGNSPKPYAIRERLFVFACDVVSDDGSSRRDFLAKERITLRELKEARLRLRVLRAMGLMDTSGDTLVQESVELVKIVATIIRNASAPDLFWNLDLGLWALGFGLWALGFGICSKLTECCID